MKFDIKARYPAPAATVLKMFMDKEFHAKKLVALGITKSRVLEHDAKGDDFRIKVERKVPLVHEFREELIVDTVKELFHTGDVPAIIFVFGREQCFEVARLLKSCRRFTTDEEKAKVEKMCDDALLPSGAAKELRPLLTHGIGIHHAGILPRYKQLVEQLALERLIKFVVSTETIAAGINLPARTVVFPALRKFIKKQARLVTVIGHSTDRLLRLVNQMLELSRLRAGVLPLARERVDLASVVGRAVEELRPQAEEGALTLTRERVGDRFDARGDEDRLVQVVVNLVANAVRFTPRGGRVTVRLIDAGPEIEIQVEDTGVGIPAAALPQIFESWRQAHNDRGGTGLGLAVVRGIVQAHGGRVTVESQEGKGSRFTVLVPREP